MTCVSFVFLNGIEVVCVWVWMSREMRQPSSGREMRTELFYPPC
jgi:hypothetical protein